jgi:tripartite-type tricarboxylate transporter receptor subunit TctC
MRAFTTLIRQLLSVCLLAVAATASAQTYPTRPIEWVVPYPAGGGTDVVARMLGDAMGKTLGQTIIVTKKPGAATNIGADYVAHARADGYTLLSADTGTLAANPALYRKLNYSAEKDFAPVGLMARFPLILAVNPKVPAKNLKEFIAWAKGQGEGANFASPGSGSPHHLATVLFGEQAGLKLMHIPYRGAAPAIQDVVSGQVPFMFVDTASGSSFIAAGKLRAIGVASAQRVKNFDTIPTLAEQGLKGFEASAWQGLVVPTGTPPEVVARLSKALVQALGTTEVKARFQALGLEAIPGTPAQMAAYAQSERKKWGAVIRANGIKLD